MEEEADHGIAGCGVVAGKMGTALSKRKSGHLAPLCKPSYTSSEPQTQADVLQKEAVVVEVVVEDSALWNEMEGGTGLTPVALPTDGKMTRVRISGQVVLYVGNDGKPLLFDTIGQ